tara:strand:+ start:819 stop:1292 length:474 start_codon:yes stop_codon:yes gene_type:complete
MVKTNIVLGYIVKGNKILLLNRNKPPYKDYWCLVGGKIKLGEHFDNALLREVLEETNLKFEKSIFLGLGSEVIKENDIVKEHWLMMSFLLKCENDSEMKASDEGDIQWFDLNNLPKNVFPSDKRMIEEYLIKKTNSHLFFEVEEKNGEYEVNERVIQ